MCLRVKEIGQSTRQGRTGSQETAVHRRHRHNAGKSDRSTLFRTTIRNLPDAQCSHPVPLLHGGQPQSSRRPSEAEQRMNSGPCRLSSEASFRTDEDLCRAHQDANGAEFSRVSTTATPPSARTHVHQLVFRDAGWYRRFRRFERGRALNSLNSQPFLPRKTAPAASFPLREGPTAETAKEASLPQKVPCTGYLRCMAPECKKSGWGLTEWFIPC